MGEHHGDGDFLFTGNTEFGPIMGNGQIKVNLTPVDEHCKARRCNAFRGRPYIGQRVRVPFTTFCRVCCTTPQIDDKFTVDDQRYRCADIGALGKI